jgi:LPXTG-motif cell wall-anchored protein
MTTSSKWRAALAATAASAVLTAAPVLGAQSAFAQPYPPLPPSLTLSSTVVGAGDDVDFTGTGFEANQDVEADLASRIVVLGHFTADATGAVEGTVTIPERTKPGEHLFLLRAEDPDLTLTAEITVTDGDSDHYPGGGRPGGDHGGDHGGRPGGDHGGDHGGRPGGDQGSDHGGRPGGDHGSDPTGEPVGEPSGDNGSDSTEEPGKDNGGKWGHDHHGKPHLANTGGERSALLMGGAAGLLLLGGGVLFLTRRVRRG